MREADDTALAVAAAAGDREAFTELVRRHHRLVFRWALVVSGDADDADDLAQEAWIRAHTGLERFRASGRFTTWLYRIVHNTAAEMGRKRRRRATALSTWLNGGDVDRSSAPPEDEPDHRHLVTTVRSLLHHLPPQQRAVLAMADLDGVPTVEIAERLGIAETTVRVTLANARRAMRGRLVQGEPGLSKDHLA